MTAPSFSFPVSDLPPAPPPPQPAPASAPAAAPAQPAPAAAPVNPNPPPAPNIGQARINAGPGIPAELVGRTINEALQLYGVVKQEALRAHQQPAAPAPASAPTPAATQAPGQPAVPAAGSFWSNPEAAIERIVQKQVNAAVGQVQAPAAIQAARDQAAAALGPDFVALEPYVKQQLAGASPELLANPQTWGNMFHLVFGQAVRAGWRPTAPAAAPAAPQPAAPPQPTPQFQPAFSMPAGGMNPGAGQPWVHPSSFFSETPGGGGPASIQPLSAAQKDAAQRMGMTEEAYRAWNGGR